MVAGFFWNLKVFPAIKWRGAQINQTIFPLNGTGTSINCNSTKLKTNGSSSP